MALKRFYPRTPYACAIGPDKSQGISTVKNQDGLTLPRVYLKLERWTFRCKSRDLQLFTGLYSSQSVRTRIDTVVSDGNVRETAARV